MARLRWQTREIRRLVRTCFDCYLAAAAAVRAENKGRPAGPGRCPAHR